MEYYKLEENFTLQDVISEAERCLNCKIPQCVKGCPAHVNIPKYIEKLKDMKIEEAYNIITENNVLPSFTSRLCYKCSQCEGNCALGKKGKPIQIGKLEEYVSDYVRQLGLYREEDTKKTTKKIQVAIVGAGVAGLAAAIVLAKEGCIVTIYEKESDIGGVVRYEIPNSRFDKSLIDDLKEEIEELKIDIIYNITIGKNLKLLDLKKKNDYIILATGAGNPHILSLEGEMDVVNNPINDRLHKLMYSSKFLRLANFDPTLKLVGNIVVVGGGNTALDCARAVINDHNDTYVYYRRSQSMMPARIDEIEDTKREGVGFKFFVSPKKVRLEDNELYVTFIKTKIERDENGIEKVVEIKDSEFEEKVQHLIIATGYEANHDVYSDEILNLKVDINNNIEVNDKLMVYNNDNMYAVGDLVTGSLTVVNAIKMGMEAARNILSDNLI